jgi:hypothetical protein
MACDLSDSGFLPDNSVIRTTENTIAGKLEEIVPKNRAQSAEIERNRSSGDGR